MLELEENEDDSLYKTIFQSNPEMMLVCSFNEGKFIRGNRTFLQLVGFSAPELKNRSIVEVGIMDNTEWNQIIAQVITFGKVLEFEISLQHKDGRKFLVLLSADLIHCNNESCVLCVIRDFTEKNFSLAFLTGGISHDLNNLLMVILGNISVLRLSKTWIKEDEESLQEIEGAAMRCRELTHQLLSIAKKSEPIKKLSYIQPLIKEAAQLILRNSKSKYEYHFEEPLPRLDMDPGQISQVLSNILRNADQAMRSGGLIQIRAKVVSGHNINVIVNVSKEQDYVEIAIEDQGCGIPEEIQSQIVLPYFSTKRGASGMGLATSYSIIKQHGGIIVFNSIVDKGTTFFIYLPIPKGANLETHVSGPSVQELYGNILVIEDDLVIHDVLKRLLQKLGLESVFAIDGQSGLEIFQQSMTQSHQFNVVLIDLSLHGTMNGIDVVKKIHEIDPQMKCIITSGYTNDPVMINYAKYGFSGAITKPYTISQFYEIMQKALQP